MKNGFTLLEVVIAITIFSISVLLLLEIESNNIRHIENSFKRLKALSFFQQYILRIKTQSDEYLIETEKKHILPQVKEVKNKIIDRNDKKEVLEIITYEK